MAEFKVVVSDPKSGKSKQIQLSEANSKGLIGKKIKDIIRGELIDMPGYEFQITGGSDIAGFPMRMDIPGTGRRKILSGKSTGVRKLRNKQDRIRKTVSGNTFHDGIAQINMKIVKSGPKPLFEAEPEEDKKELVKEEKPKQEKKEAPPKEESTSVGEKA